MSIDQQTAGRQKSTKSASAPAAIDAKSICKKFGDVEALEDVTLSIARGKVYSLLGPNGAGKTTFIKILTTLLKPDAGTAAVGGFDVVRQPERVREIIGLAGQYAAVDENLTGRENLEMVGRLYHIGRKRSRELTTKILERLELTEAADRRSKTYSGGMRRRLDLGASFITSPEILFLDEPTTGLDPYGRSELWGVIRELVKGGTTLLLTTQDLEEAEELADVIAIIDRGRIIAEGTGSELKDKIGGSVLEYRLRSVQDLEPAVAATGGLYDGEPSVEPAILRVSGKVEHSSDALIEVVRRLDQRQIDIADIRLRRPSLNEVFLTLTHKDRNR